MRVGPVALLAVGLAFGVVAACTRDHSSLEKEPTGAGAGDGGATTVGVSVGGTTGAGFGGSGAQGAGAPSSAATGAGGDGDDRPVEPDGPTRIVLVHGIADRGRIAFCFATPEGDAVDVPPFPVGGMAFARAIDVAAETLPASDAVVVLIAGDEADLEAASCQGLLADPADAPELEIAVLGLVPADAIASPRVLVLAATGCLGGEDHENELQEQACGAGYGPFSPTASLVAASPSRIAGSGVGFQAIGASLAADAFDVRLRPGLDGVSFLVAPELTWGASAPFPPNADRDAAIVGVPAQLGAVATLPGDMNTVLAEIALAEAAERAGISTFSDGEAYTIVFVGASPGLGEGPWWRAFDAVLIPPG